MAYNLQPLITILEQTLNPKQKKWIVDDNKPQLQSLLQKATSLQQILEKSPLTKIESLEIQIRDAAHKAEDMIESNMVDQMLSNPKGASFTFSTPDLQQVMQELDSVMEQVAKLIKEQTVSSGSSSRGVSFSQDLSSKAVVGVDEDLRQLMDRLIGTQSKLEIVPIVGMGGIGKTTLARKLYHDLAIVKHFTCRAWTTVSQDYNMKAILSSLISCINVGKDEQHPKNNIELKEILYRSLYGRRYLIVLDDVWSNEFWNEIQMLFPNNDKGSRVVITTRESDVAKHTNSRSKQHEMQLMNESESWNLLRREVFGDGEDCPAGLERIGRNIARNCGGLPLAICVIGGLLSKANRTQGFWKNVANDVRAAIAKSDGQLSDILSLSYNHLPIHLKPCFLYMGAFPEDYEIKASRLIRLLVAEGFLKSKGKEDLEEEAEDCLKALVDRNLVSVRAIKSDGRAKRYSMHDLMRDLCSKKAEEERFAHIGKKRGGVVQGMRRVSIHSSIDNINRFYASESISPARSFLCTGFTRCRILSDVLLELRSLRVLDLFEIEFLHFPIGMLQILNLRYLAFSYSVYIQRPFNISRYCYLQTLVIFCMFGTSISLPCEILQMAELRHVVVYGGTILFDFHDGSDWGGFMLDKLQTIFSLKSSHEFLHRIPNVKKLGIKDESCIFGLHHLYKLETLRFSCDSFCRAIVCPSILRLPHSLKRLSLTRCKIVGKFMKYLSELPNLEVLKLKYCEFEGGETREWDATQQEFCRLKFLLLDGVKLVKWEADETSFPRLRHLVIRDSPALKEIPSGIGEIPTLQTIELDKYNSRSLVASARGIIEEQRDNGNYDLHLRM